VTKPATVPTAPPDWLDWAGVALITLCAALAGLLETLLVPLYLGRVIFPITVLLTVASNALLPRLARSLVPRTVAALLPLLAWLAVVIVFGVLTRPEGDVILPGAPEGAELVTYAVLLGGALVGTVTTVMLTPPPLTKEQAARARVSR
jgi:hypothetical protein